MNNIIAITAIVEKNQENWLRGIINSVSSGLDLEGKTPIRRW